MSSLQFYFKSLANKEKLSFMQSLAFSGKVSLRSKRISFLLLGAVSLTFLPLSAHSSEKSDIPIRKLIVQQEKSRSDGVLVSRPRLIDTKIVDLISLHKIQTLQDYSRWLTKNIQYQRDQLKDHWASPEETLAVKSGDCEDYAFLTSSVAQVLGYQPQLIAMVSSKRAHAICVFKDNGYYLWFDNENLIQTPSKSFPEFIKHMMDNYKYTSMLELDPQTHKWKILYKKS